MEFYIGGYAQGKLAYVLAKYGGQKVVVIDAADAGHGDAGSAGTDTGEKIILNHLHLLVKNALERERSIADGELPEHYVRRFLEEHPDCILISDEVGCGIVPVSSQEREYRERLGRLQIEIAAKAERVERVICGLGQRLK